MVSTLDHLRGYRLVLASASPRRRELLAGLGLTFEVRTGLNVDERYPADLPAAEVPLYLSKLKAAAYRPRLAADELLITADTVVCLDNRVLGKPANRNEAGVMLQALSAKTHTVVTGVALTTRTKQHAFSVSSEVHFVPLRQEEIDYYIDHYKPFDKAGAYGIQEWIGMIGIDSIHGSFFNVMGLPVQRLYTELKQFAVD